MLHAVLSRFSRVRLCASLWTGACQVPLSMGLARQEYCNRLPCPLPGDLPHPGVEPVSPASPALQVDSLPLSHRAFPGGASGKEPTCQCRRSGFHPWVRKIPWRRKWLPIPVFSPRESHGQRSLAGYSPWSCKRARHDLATKP